MKKIISYKIINLLLIVFLTTSCGKSARKIFPTLADKQMTDDYENASPEFREGWKDGCETGISSGANTFYKMFYRNNQVDGFRISSSSEYATGWEYAFWYCYRATYVRQKSSLWGSIMKGYR